MTPSLLRLIEQAGGSVSPGHWLLTNDQLAKFADLLLAQLPTRPTTEKEEGNG